VIVAVGGDKGAPGATTLAVTLAAVWAGERVLAELDPRGADLPFRLHHDGGGPVQERPSIAALAVDARQGNAAPAMDRHAQPTSLGVPLIPGELSPRTMANLTQHLPAIAQAAAAWRGVVIADLGVLLPGNSALALAKAALVTLIATRTTLEGLSRLVERVEALSDVTGDASRTAPPVGVVVVAEPGDVRAAVERTARLLAAAGSPTPVVGAIPLDPRGVADLYAQAPGKKLLKSPLVRAARELVGSMYATWPDLTQVANEQMTRVPGYEPSVPPTSPPLAEQAQRRQAIPHAAATPSARGQWQPPVLDWPGPGGQQR
jgi:cellulose biosynthesis protein BcsQ